MVEAAAFQVKLTPDNSDYVVYTLSSNLLVYPFLLFPLILCESCSV